jgi:hypothetical protein
VGAKKLENWRADVPSAAAPSSLVALPAAADNTHSADGAHNVAEPPPFFRSVLFVVVPLRPSVRWVGHRGGLPSEATAGET